MRPARVARTPPAGRPAGTSGPLATLAAVFYILLWASAYAPSKVAATTSPPLWFLVARFVAAGLVMAGLVLALRRPFPRSSREWCLYPVLGVLANAGYLGLTYTALSHGLASGVGAIIASTNPLIVAVVAPWFLREPLGARKALGLVCGFGGVVGVILARTGTPTAQPTDAALAFLGVISSVASTILFKRVHRGSDLLAINAIQLGAAGAALVPVAALLEGAPGAELSGLLLASFGYLVLVLSVGGSLIWFWLLARGDASRVSAFYFLTPVFGLAFGAALLHEPVGPADLVGLGAVALGIVVVQRG